jgi:hypothetical protein
LIDTRRDLHRVDRKFGVYVVFDLPSTGLIDEFFGCFGNHGEADVVQPVEELLERRMFIILEDSVPFDAQYFVSRFSYPARFK